MLIRKIFSVFALVMAGLLVARVYADIWTDVNWYMFGISLFVCLLVFRCFVYIFNFSYAAACVFNGALIIGFMPSIASAMLGGAMILYGMRLWLFTQARVKSASYAPRVENINSADRHMPVFVKAALWLQCSLLYTFHLFAVYLVAAMATLSLSVLLGTAIILLGIIIESIADAQKQTAKASAPDNFVRTGLFGRWRHPNYSGEIIVQIGLIVAGVGAVVGGWASYLAVCVSPVYIILLMISEGLRADQALHSRYDSVDGFGEYWQNSSSLLPKIG